MCKVSIIIATKNEEKNMDRICESIQKQAYKDYEVIVIDNNSSDKTKEISLKYTDKVYNRGPERCSQRNYGASIAKGELLLFLDADMVLTETVVEDCVHLLDEEKDFQAVVIPETSVGEGFWAECKALERSFYVGIDYIEAPRFFRRAIFNEVGGYDENLVSGEDWDIYKKIKSMGKVGRVNSFIHHNEGKPTLISLISGKIYYAKHFSKFMKKGVVTSEDRARLNVITRFLLYFNNPQKLFAKPVVGVGMLFMKICEFTAGGLTWYFLEMKGNNAK